MLPLLEKIIAVKKPVSGLPKSLIAQYEALGTAAAFRVEPIEKGLLFMGKTAKVALKVEFGNRWEFFNTITELRETDADIKVLVTSSNSKAMKMETVYTVLKKKLEEKKRWVLIDIEGKFINGKWDIYIKATRQDGKVLFDGTVQEYVRKYSK